MQLTTNFHIDEFQSKDGSDMPNLVFQNVALLANDLQMLRNYLTQTRGKDTPIQINSAYRSPIHNAAIGGVKNSTHTTGIAADITIKGMKPKEVSEAIQYLRNNGNLMAGGLGVYHDKNFVHYDFRGYEANWSEGSEVKESEPKSIFNNVPYVLGASCAIGCGFLFHQYFND